MADEMGRIRNNTYLSLTFDGNQSFITAFKMAHTLF